MASVMALTRLTEDEAVDAALSRIKKRRGRPAVLVFEDGASVRVSAQAVEALFAAIEDSETAHPATLVRHTEWLSPQEAAELIGVSRPYVHTLIDKRVLAAKKVGSRWLVDPEIVVAYKQVRDASPVTHELAQRLAKYGPMTRRGGVPNDDDRLAATRILDDLRDN